MPEPPPPDSSDAPMSAATSPDVGGDLGNSEPDVPAAQPDIPEPSPQESVENSSLRISFDKSRVSGQSPSE